GGDDRGREPAGSARGRPREPLAGRNRRDPAPRHFQQRPAGAGRGGPATRRAGSRGSDALDTPLRSVRSGVGAEPRECDLDEIRRWVTEAAQAASAKGGDDTVVLEGGGLLGLSDGFVITGGTSRREWATTAQ